MVQPVVAHSLLGDALAAGQGLLGRFVICQPASTQGSRDYGHTPAPASFSAIEAFAERVLDTLARPLPLRDDTDNELEPRFLPLSFEARRELCRFGNDIEDNLAPGGSLRPVSGAANKAAEQACRIAGVLTLMANPDAIEVDAPTMQRGTALADFYLSEALRLTGAAPVAQEVAEAETLRPVARREVRGRMDYRREGGAVRPAGDSLHRDGTGGARHAGSRGVHHGCGRAGCHRRTAAT
jgi:hypothetical protein